MVLSSAGWDDQICGKSAEEIRGCLPDELSQSGLAQSLGGNERCHPLLGATWSAHVSRRQSSYKAQRLLGMDHLGDPEGLSGCDFSGGSLYPPKDDESAGKIGVHAIVHLFHMAQYQVGDYRIPDGVNSNGNEVLFPCKFLSEYARHLADISSNGRASGLFDSFGSRHNAYDGLWDLQRIRALRERTCSR